MILGTSIAGVLRKDFDGDVNDIFGKDNGSKIIISNALILDENNRVNEELLLQKTPFLKIFENLPLREHTAITGKGVAKEHSKFDEEVVYKGTRFKFSIEFIEDDKNTFSSILELLASSSFRLGGGSTKGFGKFKIIEVTTTDKECSSSLNTKLDNTKELKKLESSTYTTYTLKIKPDDFFMFGSGFGDEDADMTPVYEKVVDYKQGKLSDEMILIPASSIKGALSHRTTYHYNKIKGNTIENGNGIDTVTEIFGEAKNSKENIDGSRGKVIFSDCFQAKANEKVFDHVSIDRFTGGAIDGALFQEKTVTDNREYEIELLLHEKIEGDELEAFEHALTDITTGMLPLGGSTTKGHGIFTGTWSKS
jgi:CRISPR/Cas system CSM-associated protein Csm3 (group 7 of RAMP superfamily)